MRLKTLFLLGAAAYAWKHFSAKANAGGGRVSRRHQEHDLDMALDDTFPASDAPSTTVPHRDEDEDDWDEDEDDLDEEDEDDEAEWGEDDDDWDDEDDD